MRASQWSNLLGFLVPLVIVAVIALFTDLAWGVKVGGVVAAVLVAAAGVGGRMISRRRLARHAMEELQRRARSVLPPESDVDASRPIVVIEPGATDLSKVYVVMFSEPRDAIELTPVDGDLKTYAVARRFGSWAELDAAVKRGELRYVPQSAASDAIARLDG